MKLTALILALCMTGQIKQAAVPPTPYVSTHPAKSSVTAHKCTVGDIQLSDLPEPGCGLAQAAYQRGYSNGQQEVRDLEYLHAHEDDSPGHCVSVPLTPPDPQKEK